MMISVQGSLGKLPVDKHAHCTPHFQFQLEQRSAPWQDPDGEIRRLLRPDSQGDRHWSNTSFSVEEPRQSWQVFLAESEQPGSAWIQYPLEAKTVSGERPLQRTPGVSAPAFQPRRHTGCIPTAPVGRGSALSLGEKP